MDESGAKGRAKEVEGGQTWILHVLDLRWLLPDDCGVALKRRVKKSMSSPSCCMEWPKELRLRRF